MLDLQKYGVTKGIVSKPEKKEIAWRSSQKI
jgi:hypothetical protein